MKANSRNRNAPPPETVEQLAVSARLNGKPDHPWTAEEVIDIEEDQGWANQWAQHWAELNVDEVLELKPHEVASYCERVLDAPALIRELESCGYLTPREARKQFCEFLGIGESTLSGWLKAQRVPRMANEAYVLLKTLLLLQDQVKRLKEEQVRNDTVIVQESSGKYHLVRFKKDNSGALMGRIIARDIPDEATARILGAGKVFESLGVEHMHEHLIEMNELRAKIDRLQAEAAEIEAKARSDARRRRRGRASNGKADP
jgi:hypothetical protein